MNNTTIPLDQALSAITAARAEILDRVRRASAGIEDARRLMSEHAAERADAIRDALATGMSQADVARELGLSPSAVNGALIKH